MRRLTGLPSDVLASQMARQNVRGMWLKCGAKPRVGIRKKWLKHWNREQCCNAQDYALVLTSAGARPYNLAHTARRPLTARLRASEAPHFCVDRTSEKKSEDRISSASRLAPGGLETARFPGCLTSESEERETWTAESLRTAPVKRATFLRCGHGRDFGGRRFRSSLMSISASNRRRGQ